MPTSTPGCHRRGKGQQRTRAPAPTPAPAGDRRGRPSLPGGTLEILSPNTERRERSTAGSLTGKPAMAHPLRWLPVRLNTLPWESEARAEHASVRWEPEAPGRSRRGAGSPPHVAGSRLAFCPGEGQAGLQEGLQPEKRGVGGVPRGGAMLMRSVCVGSPPSPPFSLAPTLAFMGCATEGCGGSRLATGKSFAIGAGTVISALSYEKCGGPPQ